MQRFAIPDIPSGAKGEATLTGGFDLGDGHYRVDWLMRDVGERFCSSHWEVEVKPGRRERNLPLTLEPNTMAGRVGSTADDSLPLRASQPRHVKILLNLSPATPREGVLAPGSAAVLLSMLRAITRQPGVSSLSLVAFNVWEQKIIARQDRGGKIDLAALAQAAQAPTNATVDYRSLQEPQSEMHFATKLLADELGFRTASLDAIIIVGRKVSLPQKVPLQLLKESGTASCPIFYLNYNLNPAGESWPDTISSALKAYPGALTYNIVLPGDLGSRHAGHTVSIRSAAYGCRLTAHVKRFVG